jgi:hypothetical protein
LKVSALASGTPAAKVDADRPRAADPALVRDYLVGKGVQPRVADSEAESVTVPFSVTKRSTLAFARKL